MCSVRRTTRFRKGGECQREPALVEKKVAILRAAAQAGLAWVRLAEIQAAAAAGRERAALGRFLEGAGGVVADDALEIERARRSKSRGGPGRGDDEREGEGETVHLLWN